MPVFVARFIGILRPAYCVWIFVSFRITMSTSCGRVRNPLSVLVVLRAMRRVLEV